MTLAWNLLFYIEDCMAIKWGSTLVTAVKWGSTVCTQVKWGNTVVFPDASGAAVYSYGGNVFGGDIGNLWNTGLHSEQSSGFNQGGTYIKVNNPDSVSVFTLASTNISLTQQSVLWMCAPPGSTDTWYKNTTKIKIICNLTFFCIQNNSAGTTRISVGEVNGMGQLITGYYTIPNSDTSKGLGYDNRFTLTGGTYDIPYTWSTNTNFKRWGIQIYAAGTYNRMTGTISSIEFLA